MSSQPPAGQLLGPEQERRLAAHLFNSTWDLLETENRTPADDDRMLHMAHASRYHWGQVGSAAQLARGETHARPRLVKTVGMGWEDLAVAAAVVDALAGPR